VVLHRAIQWPTNRSRIWSIELRHFQWPWTTPTLSFKVTLFFGAEYLGSSTRYRRSFNDILIRTYTLKQLIIKDCTGDIVLLKLQRGTKHRAASLRQQNTRLCCLCRCCASRRINIGMCVEWLTATAAFSVCPCWPSRDNPNVLPCCRPAS